MSTTPTPTPERAPARRPLVLTGGPAVGKSVTGRGQAQQVLGVLDATSTAGPFLDAGFDAVDVLTPGSAPLYRRELPGCVVVHLVVTFEEATRRAATRPSWLTSCRSGAEPVRPVA